MPIKLPRFLKSLRSLRKKRGRAFKIASRHPSAVPVLTFLLLFAITGISFGIARAGRTDKPRTDAQIVILSYDHQKQIVPSREHTVSGLLQKLNIHLGEGDVVEPELTATIDQDDFRINIYRGMPVQVVDGQKISYTFSAAKTPRSIVQQAKTTVYPEDLISTQPVEDFTKAGAIGQQVIIDRAVPVNLNLYGTSLPLRTHAYTVGDLIKQKNIVVAKDDQIMPAPETPLTPNAQVFVVRNGIKIESVTEDIPMPVQKETDPNLAYGTKAVRQAGSPGKQVVTYQNTLRNDKVVGRVAIQTVVTQQPVTQIEVVGTSISGIKGDMARAGIAPSDYDYVDYIVSHESGWNPQAHNASGAYGLCQALPGSKMASAGSDWATNPVTQLRWCAGYAQGRYGSWAAAYSYWVSHRYW